MIRSAEDKGKQCNGRERARMNGPRGGDKKKGGGERGKTHLITSGSSEQPFHGGSSDRRPEERAAKLDQ